MSYRSIRDVGLLTLFLIIFGISLFSYNVTNRSTQRLKINISAEDTRIKMGRLLQLIKYSRSNFEDLSLGKIDDIIMVSAPLERAAKEIQGISIDKSGRKSLEAIKEDIQTFRSAVSGYIQADKNSQDRALLQSQALKVAYSASQEMQVLIDKVSQQINEKNLAIIKETYRFQKILGLSLIGAIIAVLLIALWMGITLAKPIKQLEEATESIAKGNLETQLELKSHDEIGSLFESFNQMVRELRESRAKLVEKTYVDSIITNMVDALIVTDSEEKIKTVNKAACLMLGYSQEELSDNDISLIIGHKERFKNEVIQTIKDKGCLDNYELDYKRKDQGLIPMLFSGSILNDNKGNKIGFLMVARDITERKELEKKYRLAELGKLVADMAHEVNNPLMVISGRAELSLMQDIKNQKIIDNLNLIVEYAQRAKDIITRLLRFSRPSKGQLKEVDINKAIEEVVSIIEHQFSLNNIKINKSYKELPCVVADEKQIQEVLMNLFNNARDAMPGGGTIAINTYQEADFVRVDIKDNGIGIKKDILDKIFDPFFTTKDKGTGLGIPLCYNTIKSYGGDLEFNSQVNKGTTATMTLPIRKG
jgi:two-component system NtrC family sensor kinase